MWSIHEFQQYTYLLGGAVPFQAAWDLSSPTRAQTCAPPAVEDRQGSPSRHILMECLPSIGSVLVTGKEWKTVRHASVEFTA